MLGSSEGPVSMEVFKVMQVNDVEILRSNSRCTFFKRSTDASVRIVHYIIAALAGVRVFADFSGKKKPVP